MKEDLTYKSRRSDWYIAVLMAGLSLGIILLSIVVQKQSVTEKTHMLSAYLQSSILHIEEDISTYLSNYQDKPISQAKLFLKRHPGAEIIIGEKRLDELDFQHIYSSQKREKGSKSAVLLPRVNDHSILARDHKGLFVVEQSYKSFLGSESSNRFILGYLQTYQDQVRIFMVFLNLDDVLEGWYDHLDTPTLLATYIKNDNHATLLAHRSHEISKTDYSLIDQMAVSYAENFIYKNANISVSHILHPGKAQLLLLLIGFLAGLGSLIFFLKALLVLRYDFYIKRRLAEEKNIQLQLQNEIKKLDKDYVALRKNAREYRHVLDSISDIVFETDMKGHILFMNETFERATDTPVWDIIKTPFWNIFHEDDRERVQLLIESYIQGQRYASYEEARLLLADGSYKVVEISLNMVRIPDNQDICLVGSMADIDHRVRSEEALREAEEKYRSMVEKSLGGIYRSAPEGRFIDANPAMAQILGYESVDELLSRVKDINQQFYCDSHSREKILAAIKDDGLTDVEARVYRKDGSVIWVSESFRPVYDEETDELLYYEGTIVDITRRKVIEAALLKAKTHSDMASRAKSEFLANMSHELRTPLNAIIGFSEILKNELFGPLGKEEYKEYSQDIYNSGTHLLQIINDILDMSKIEAGKRDLKEEAMLVQDVARVAFKMVKPKADSRSIDLEDNVPEDLPILYAEQLAVKQILINLLNNAVKFTQEGGRVELSTSFSDKGEMILTVSDTGIGMRAEDIEKALSAFGQIDGELSKKESGTGLGLTLVKQLTELHGGYIKVESEVNQGTKIHVVFPENRVNPQ